MKNKKTVVTFEQMIRAQKSIRGRQSRMRKVLGMGWDNYQKSPIEDIGVFDSEITQMENALNAMQNRINNATIKI